MRHSTQTDFERLLTLRTTLRRFLHFSERRSKEAGLTPAQHQLMVAIRGHPKTGGPTIGDVAGYLLLRHHSAVGLVDRAVAAGLVKRNQDPRHAGTVRLTLTATGEQKLQALADAHREELSHLASTLRSLTEALGEEDPAAAP